MPSSSIAATTVSALSSPRVTTWPYVPSIDQASSGLAADRADPVADQRRSPPLDAPGPVRRDRRRLLEPEAGRDQRRHEEHDGRDGRDGGRHPERHQDPGHERPEERPETLARAPDRVRGDELARAPGDRRHEGDLRRPDRGSGGRSDRGEHEQLDHRDLLVVQGVPGREDRRARSGRRWRPGSGRARPGSGRRGSARASSPTASRPTTAGIIRTAPSRAAAMTPPRLKTVTRVTTTRAASAATPSIQVIPSRRIPSFDNA